MQHNPFHKDILPFSIGSEISAWLGGSDLKPTPKFSDLQHPVAVPVKLIPAH